MIGNIKPPTMKAPPNRLQSPPWIKSTKPRPRKRAVTAGSIVIMFGIGVLGLMAHSSQNATARPLTGPCGGTCEECPERPDCQTYQSLTGGK